MKNEWQTECSGAPSRRKFVMAATAAMLLGGVVPSAMAEDASSFPSKPITIMVPFSAGGTTDILARLIGQKLTERWKVAVVVDNKLGAGGNIGSAQVARSTPDGYTLVMGTIGTHAINPSLYASMPYDALKDFAPITRTAMVPNVLVVNPASPFNNVKEMIDYAKANPGKLTFGSSGHGSTLQLSGELFKMMAQVDMVHVPYKGSSPAVADLLGNQITMIFDNMPSSLPHVKAGKLKALGVTSSTRVSQLPDAPTLSEAGVPGYEVMSWFGLWAPAKTPQPIVEKLNHAIVEILKSPEVQQKISEQGAVPTPETPAEFDRFIRAETDKWSKVVKAAKLQAM
ncbi:tripartite tricarboxylate transporter substrate binding protein (plasmid) [Diaphorobacter sp. HDW4B]|uniref:Bug family tripartite tricarboxylate transporter substrate binding protein n=1 Tax=Diaphorobacter sp. HDW4B TaxID=2714925 RepID=UPI00140E91BF|nr:tripartite tricarboxylate transporter substrate binding protein [Diaphorobacter sp. HDW4B]QIL74165.1 tripartite tricarboxylate transporter substrate binding protein [Diaphorobacter sp. HDW4B]